MCCIFITDDQRSPGQCSIDKQVGVSQQRKEEKHIGEHMEHPEWPQCGAGGAAPGHRGSSSHSMRAPGVGGVLESLKQGNEMIRFRFLKNN